MKVKIAVDKARRSGDWYTLYVKWLRKCECGNYIMDDCVWVDINGESNKKEIADALRNLIKEIEREKK